MSKYDELPEPVKQLLHSQFIGYLRQQFEEMQQEVLISFLDLPETQKQYAEYEDWVWQETLREGDTDWDFIEFLQSEFGITVG